VLGRGPDVVALVGARRPDRLAEALDALSARLDDATLAALEAALPPGVAAGSRYPEAAMAELDSER
jgi:aryl-alcohol dehydrogenase-like predicted oxidoreductase